MCVCVCVFPAGMEGRLNAALMRDRQGALPNLSRLKDKADARRKYGIILPIEK